MKPSASFRPMAKYRREPIDEDLPITGRTLLCAIGIVALVIVWSFFSPNGWALDTPEAKAIRVADAALRGAALYTYTDLAQSHAELLTALERARAYLAREAATRKDREASILIKELDAAIAKAAGAAS